MSKTPTSTSETAEGSKFFIFETYSVFHEVQRVLLERYVKNLAYDATLKRVVSQHMGQLRWVVQTACKQLLMDAAASKIASTTSLFIPILKSLDEAGLLRDQIDILDQATMLDHVMGSKFIEVVTDFFEDIDQSLHFIKSFQLNGDDVICEIVPFSNVHSYTKDMDAKFGNHSAVYQEPPLF